jgi:hypothetical protein
VAILVVAISAPMAGDASLPSFDLISPVGELFGHETEVLRGVQIEALACPSGAIPGLPTKKLND